MRSRPFIIALCFLLLGCRTEQHPLSEIEQNKNGVYVRNGKPYTGIGYSTTDNMLRDSVDECEYDDGVMIRWTTFNDDYRRFSEGVYDGDGRKETWWYTNGKVQRSSSWMNDSLKDGSAYYGLFDGQTWIESNWTNGKKHGKFVKWYPSGQMHYKKEFDNGLPSGDWAYWLEDGEVLCKTNFLDSIPRTIYVKLNGADSVAIAYFDNGNLNSYTSYKDDVENGLYLEFWESNQLLRAKGMMRAGMKDGKWTRLAEYGCNYLSLNYESEWHIRRVSNQGRYVLGKEEGVWTMYMDENNPDQKWMEATYQNGERHGRFTMWDDEGNISVDEMYSKGELVSDSTSRE